MSDIVGLDFTSSQIIEGERFDPKNFHKKVSFGWSNILKRNICFKYNTEDPDVIKYIL